MTRFRPAWGRMNESLSASLKLQSTIVHALILQDMSARYARTRLGVFTAVVEPVVVVGAMYIIRFYIQGQHSVGGIPMVLFVVTGFLTDFCFRIVTGIIISSTERKTSSRMFPQVTSLDVVIARAISSTTITGGAMIVVFFIASLMTGRPPADMLLCFIAGWAVFSLAIPVGMVLGVVLRKLPGLRILVGSLLRVNLVLSGAFFLGTELPARLLPYVSWNPTFHIIELMREGWFHGYVSPIASPAYILVCCLGFLSLGLPLERLTRGSQVR